MGSSLKKRLVTPDVDKKLIVTMSTTTETKPTDTIKKGHEQSASPAVRVTRNLNMTDKQSSRSNTSQKKRMSNFRSQMTGGLTIQTTKKATKGTGSPRAVLKLKPNQIDRRNQYNQASQKSLVQSYTTNQQFADLQKQKTYEPMTAIKVDKKNNLLNFNLSRCSSIVSQTNSNTESNIKMEAIQKENDSAAKIQESTE